MKTYKINYNKTTLIEKEIQLYNTTTYWADYSGDYVVAMIPCPYDLKPGEGQYIKFVVVDTKKHSISTIQWFDGLIDTYMSNDLGFGIDSDIDTIVKRVFYDAYLVEPDEEISFDEITEEAFKKMTQETYDWINPENNLTV